MVVSQAYEFGPYRLERPTRRLLRNGEPVSLTPKALDTLLALIERRDSVVDKAELMKLVSPDSFVEEANLSWGAAVLGALIAARAGVLIWSAVRGRHVPVDPLARKTRLVVLPFENLTGDRKDDWLAGAFSDSEAYELLADWYFATPGYGCAHGHDPALAEKYFRTAIRIDPRFAAAWANLIYHLHFALQFDEAMGVADEAVKTLPDSGAVRRARSTALIFVNRLAEAEQVIGDIPETERSVQDQWVLGTIALARGDEADATMQFDDVLRRMPATVYELSIARSYFIANRVEEGLAYVDRAVKHDPACAEFAATAPAYAPYRDTPAFRARLSAWKSTQ
jgi:tetratricopeptide (TPR) repeat protein